MLFASKMAKSPPMVFPLIQNTGEMFSIFFGRGVCIFWIHFCFLGGFYIFLRGKYDWGICIYFRLIIVFLRGDFNIILKKINYLTIGTTFPNLKKSE